MFLMFALWKNNESYVIIYTFLMIKVLLDLIYGKFDFIYQTKGGFFNLVIKYPTFLIIFT